MSSAHLPFCLAALLVAAGCSESDEPVPVSPCGFSQRQGVKQPAVAFLTVGAPAFVTVHADETPFCLEQRPDEPRVSDTVTSEVYGPDGLLVPSTITLDARREAATLRFTPPRPGAYHAIVAFSPVGGLQQLDMLAGSDRSARVPVAELARTHCAHVDRTSRGTWFCDGAMLRPPSQEWQLLGGFATVAVAGDVVWVSEAGRVRRYVDTGTSLELTGTLVPSPEMRDSFSRLVTEQELVLLTDAGLHRITFSEEQGLTAWPTLPWPSLTTVHFGEDRIEGVLLRAGATLFRVHYESTGTSGEEISRACPLRLEQHGGYAPTEEPCQRLAGRPVASEPDALWMATTQLELVGDLRMPRETLYRWAGREGRLVGTVLSLHDVANVLRNPLGGGPTVPLLGPVSGAPPTAVAAWDAEQDAPGLELFPIFGADRPRANPRFFWTQGPTVKVFAR